MNIRWKPLRDLCSVLFSIGYLFFPEQANIQAKRFPPSIQTFRVSWEKTTSNSILKWVTRLSAGYLPIRKNIVIPRPVPASPSSFKAEELPNGVLPPIKARLYHNGTEEEFRNSNELILVIPGGGFVAMAPENHEEWLTDLARTTKTVLFLD
jgi:hypothetical protein